MFVVLMSLGSVNRCCFLVTRRETNPAELRSLAYFRALRVIDFAVRADNK